MTTEPERQPCEACLGDRYIGGLVCAECGGEGAVDTPVPGDVDCNLCVAELGAGDEAAAATVFRARRAALKAE